MRIRRNKGFSVLELIIVVMLICTLAAIAMPQYKRLLEKSRASEALLVLYSIRRMQLTYRIEHGRFIDVLVGCSYNSGGASFIQDLNCGVSGVHTFCMEALGLEDPNPASKHWFFDGSADVSINAYAKNADGSTDWSKYISLNYITGAISTVGGVIY